MTIGDFVKQYRIEYNYSMDDFAKISGLSKGYISMLEKNRNPRNGKPISPSLETIKQIACATHTDFDDLIKLIDANQLIEISNNNEKNCISKNKTSTKKGVKIPVLGYVAAGIPIEAIEDIIDYEEISEEMALRGKYFGLSIKGNSMEPRICQGDVVIVRQQPDVESGELGIVLVNGNDATCKKVVKHENGISLVSFNPTYEPMFYTKEEILSLPITILGKVVELRGKF